MATINYKIPRLELEENLGVLEGENDMLSIFSIHGNLHKILIYVTYVEAKCLSVDDGSIISKGMSQLQEGKDDDCYVVEVEGGVANEEYQHGDVEDAWLHDGDDEGEGKDDEFNVEGDIEGDDEFVAEGEDGGDSGNRATRYANDGGNRAIRNRSTNDLSDYDPISDYDSPGGRGLKKGEHDFDFSKPRFRVRNGISIVKEFRQALRHYYVVKDIKIKKKGKMKSADLLVFVLLRVVARGYMPSFCYDGGSFIVKALHDAHTSMGYNK
uniref:Uncharacterized protein n=1 Tax=Nelumbo nucifera TaxID=4432 RepID=A0A822XPM2_NELNU|nr:TPA_asm: hypothetical protein HUJ06_022148 [Nelumbo nucifera]